VDYVVKEGQVIIVDEFTGRFMPGRRWSDGLHQAVEAQGRLENRKGKTRPWRQSPSRIISVCMRSGGDDRDRLFTEANEFKNIYQFDVVVLPTNQPLVRKNYPDRIYKTEKEKFNAVVDEIAELYASGKPVLVGTITIDKSEMLSEMLSAAE
jgi:preprotein translocase subunit SecA